MRLIAIETSCDDTGIAILKFGKTGRPKILADFVSSQIKVHAPWGGVVPMLAKREHQKNLVPLLKNALKKTKLSDPLRHPEGVPPNGMTKRSTDSSSRQSGTQNDKRKIKTLNKILEREPRLLKKLLPFLKKYRRPDIDYIAVTIGPGLEPALWVGVNFARALSYFWNIPIFPINHIEGHLTTAFAADESRGILNFQFSIFKKILPAIALVVSGGHTQLILIKKLGDYKIIGETRDDAVGEAFDKAAKMLNLGYPGGPAIAAVAAKSKIENLKLKIKKLPRPMINSGNLDFSFSGLKTAVLYLLQKMTPTQIKKLTPAIAAEFEQAAIDVLIAKTLSAAKKYQVKTIALAGGVAANNLLRDTLSLNTKRLSLNFLVPPRNLCTDNATMIGLAAFYQLKQFRVKKVNRREIKADANLRIS